MPKILIAKNTSKIFYPVYLLYICNSVAYCNCKLNTKHMKNYLYGIMLLFSGALFFAACGDDDDHNHNDNEVNIRIISPTDGQVITTEQAKSFEIHVMFEASDENHDVEVELYAHGQSADKIIDWQRHDHDPLLPFKEQIDLSGFAPGTEFHLDTKSCIDHDCKEVVTNNIVFSIE